MLRGNKLKINVVGDIGHQLFGLATDDEVDALKSEVDQAMKTVKVINHNQERLISIVNLTCQFTSENREDIRRLQGHVVQLSEHLRAVIGNIDMNRRLFLQIKVARNFDHWIAALETVAKEYRQECAHFDKVRGALEHEQLTEDILTVSQLQEMLNHLSKHGQVRDISWYYHNTFVDLVVVEKRRLIFKVSLWASEPDMYYQWRLSTFPIVKNTYAERLFTRREVAVNNERTQLFVPTTCKGKTLKVCKVEILEQKCCELDLIEESMPECQVEVTKVTGKVVVYPWGRNKFIVQSLMRNPIKIYCVDGKTVTHTLKGLELWDLKEGCNIHSSHVITYQATSFVSKFVQQYHIVTFPNITYRIPAELHSKLPEHLKIVDRVTVHSVKTGLDPLPIMPAWHQTYKQSVVWSIIFVVGIIGLVMWHTRKLMKCGGNIMNRNSKKIVSAKQGVKAQCETLKPGKSNVQTLKKVVKV